MIYNVRDVAEQCNVPHYHIYYLLYTGEIPEPAQLIGRTRVFNEEELTGIKAYLKEHPARKQRRTRKIA